MKVNYTVQEVVKNADDFLTISSNNKTFVPNFVNIGISSELYMKAILLHHTNHIPRGHNLEILYDKVINLIDEDNFIKYLINQYSGIQHHIEIEDMKSDLREMFESHKDLFVDWRYVYELEPSKKGSVNMLFEDFCLALKTFVHSEIIQ